MTFRFLLATCKSQQSLVKFHPALPRTTTPRSFPATNQRSSPEPGLPICFQHPSYLNLPTTTTSPQHLSQTYPPSISSPSSSIKSMISPLEVKIWQIQSVEARCQGKAVLGEFLFTFPVPGPSRPLTFCTLPKMHPTNPLSIMELVDFHGTSSTDVFRQPRWLDPGRAGSAPSGWLCPTNRFQVGWVSLTSWVHQEIPDSHAFCPIFLLKKLILPSAPQAQWWSEHQALVHNQTTPQQKPTSQLYFLVRLGDQCLGKHPHADISHVTATPWKRPGCLILERNLQSCFRASSRAALDREKKVGRIQLPHQTRKMHMLECCGGLKLQPVFEHRSPNHTRAGQFSLQPTLLEPRILAIQIKPWRWNATRRSSDVRNSSYQIVFKFGVKTTFTHTAWVVQAMLVPLA